jgi:hypothetical protein
MATTCSFVNVSDFNWKTDIRDPGFNSVSEFLHVNAKTVFKYVTTAILSSVYFQFIYIQFHTISRYVL